MRTLAAWGTCFLISVAPAAVLAQTFEGLDLGAPKKKKRSAPKRAAEPKPPPSSAPNDDAIVPVPLVPQANPQASGAGSAAENRPGAAGAGTTLSVDAVEVAGKSGDRQRLDVAVAAFADGRYEEAAVAAFEFSQTSSSEKLKIEGDYVLAKALYRLGMYHSSLGIFSRVLGRGPDTRYFRSSLEWLFYIGRKTVNEQVILDEIARFSNYEFPDRFRSEAQYLLARYHFVRGKALDEVEQKPDADKSFAEVKRLTAQFRPDDPFFIRGRYLTALSQFRSGNLEAAVDVLQQVVRATRPVAGASGAAAVARSALRDLAFMQLARTHYGKQQNRKAIFYFGKIQRGNAQWLESLFEAAWAHYRIGQHEQALGNLITLAAPFFEDEYFPEADILRAVIYFENCRYPEAIAIIDDFERRYAPVHEELKKLSEQKVDASDYFRQFAELQKKARAGAALDSKERLLAKVLTVALTDKDLKKTSESILELEDEIDAFDRRSEAFKYSALAKALLDVLRTQREGLLKKAGIMAKGKLDVERDFLQEQRANAYRIRFETNAKEKEFLESQLQAGGPQSVVRSYRYSVAVSDDDLYWPYNGEYWRDELGTYEYTLTKGCIERQSTGQ